MPKKKINKKGKKRGLISANKKKGSLKKDLATLRRPAPKLTRTGPILWAFDPFAAEGPGWDRSVEVAELLSLNGQKKIQPVYVLSPSNFNFTGDFSGPWVGQFEPKAKEAFAEVLEKVNISGLQEPAVIINKQPSLSMNVSKLLKFASKVNAEVVLMNSHARKGLARLFLGSFAETALMATSVPLILVNPEVKRVGQFKKILFPTDFTTTSRKAFRRVLSFCRDHQAQIVIYHKLPDPIEPMVQTGVYMAGGGWVSVQNYIETESEAREQESRSWVEEAQKAGVEAKFFIEEKPGFITDSLNQYITQHAVDMIAVGSKSGPVSTVVIGSIARQMVREASCPVWVVHIG